MLMLMLLVLLLIRIMLIILIILGWKKVAANLIKGVTIGLRNVFVLHDGVCLIMLHVYF